MTQGDLKSLDQTLGELLQQHRSAMSESSARTTIRQLLIMTAGWTTDYDPEPVKPDVNPTQVEQLVAGDADWQAEIIKGSCSITRSTVRARRWSSGPGTPRSSTSSTSELRYERGRDS